METCYRHPGRETGVSCSACGRPICPECMTSTPVGMRCPECARERTRVRSGAGTFSASGAPYATYALIAVNVVAFLIEIAGGGGATSVEGGGSVIDDFGLCGNAIAGDGGDCGGVAAEGGEIFRVISGAFLHAGPLHLLLNMFALYILGSLIEPAIGTLRFLGIYFASLFAGSFGALLLSDPNEVTVGASGAIFGLMAAAFVIARRRGLEDVASQIGLFVVLNLLFTFSVPGISIGGHIGGLIGGAVIALALTQFERLDPGGNRIVLEVAAVLLISAGSIVGALAAASGSI